MRWASVQPDASGESIWDVVAQWLRDRKAAVVQALNQPRLIGVDDIQGLS